MSSNAFNMEWHGEALKIKVLGVCEENVKASAERVKASARATVPKDSGGLAESIDYEFWKNTDACGAVVSAGEKNLEYIASFVELGTPGTVFTAKKSKGKTRTPIKAQPYMRPALKREKSRYKRSFSGALK